MHSAKDTAKKYGLTLRFGPHFGLRAQTAYAGLLRTVLGLAELGPLGPWVPFSFFGPGDQCVANVDAAALPLFLDGRAVLGGGLRSVAVDPAWRGRGLFAALMSEALAWCAAKGVTQTFLYTEDPALYERFGFHSLPQHAFVGPGPAPRNAPPARPLDLATANDRVIADALLQQRAPVSSQCTLEIDVAQFFANVTGDSELTTARLERPEAILVYQDDDDDLILVDIVAPVVPDLATILGALGLKPRRVKTLFPPDRLGWHGTPMRQDTGVMIRGAIPSAMTRPFMFSPTAEF